MGHGARRSHVAHRGSAAKRKMRTFRKHHAMRPDRGRGPPKLPAGRPRSLRAATCALPPRFLPPGPDDTPFAARAGRGCLRKGKRVASAECDGSSCRGGRIVPPTAAGCVVPRQRGLPERPVPEAPPDGPERRFRDGRTCRSMCRHDTPARASGAGVARFPSPGGCGGRGTGRATRPGPDRFGHLRVGTPSHRDACQKALALAWAFRGRRRPRPRQPAFRRRAPRGCVRRAGTARPAKTVWAAGWPIRAADRRRRCRRPHNRT